MITFAIIKKAEGPIPDLRPPKGEIALDLPENAVFAGAVVFAFTVLFLGRIFRVTRPAAPLVVVPPIVIARRDLSQLSGPETHAACVHIIRSYLHDGWQIGPVGATTAELVSEFSAHTLSTPALTTALESFLGETDLQRFAPHDAPAPESPAIRASELIEALEAQHQGAAAQPAPEPTPPSEPEPTAAA